MSTPSLNSNGSQNEDWDRSESDIQVDSKLSDNKPLTTPRNSVIFPADGAEKTPGRGAASKGERTLSELLKLHAEKGTEGRFSADEASRVAEVLGQWVCVRAELLEKLPCFSFRAFLIFVNCDNGPLVDKFGIVTIRG